MKLSEVSEATQAGDMKNMLQIYAFRIIVGGMCADVWLARHLSLRQRANWMFAGAIPRLASPNVQNAWARVAIASGRT